METVESSYFLRCATSSSFVAACAKGVKSAEECKARIKKQRTKTYHWSRNLSLQEPSPHLLLGQHLLESINLLLKGLLLHGAAGEMFKEDAKHQNQAKPAISYMCLYLTRSVSQRLGGYIH